MNITGSVTRRGWQPGDGITCVHAGKAPKEMPCGPPVQTEICQTNAAGRRSYPVTKPLCRQHSGIDPAPGPVMAIARKAAAERLIVEYWDTYRRYLNEAIAVAKEQQRGQMPEHVTSFVSSDRDPDGLAQ